MKKYEMYILQWMLNHGYSLSDLIWELREFQCEDPEDSDRISMPLDELFELWVQERGFGGEIWACYEEWLENEGAEDNV